MTTLSNVFVCLIARGNYGFATPREELIKSALLLKDHEFDQTMLTLMQDEFETGMEDLFIGEARMWKDKFEHWPHYKLERTWPEEWRISHPDK